MIPRIQGTSNRQTYRDGEMQGCCQGLGEGSGELLSSLGGVSVWDDGKVLELDGGMVAQQWECTPGH